MKKNGWICCAAIVTLTAIGFAQQPAESKSPAMPLKEYRIDHSIGEEARGCIECHTKESPGIVADWSDSRHAHANITCLDCHLAGPADADVSQVHFQYGKTPVSTIVSPRDCSRCHPAEAAEYAKSKHANTLAIIWKIDMWMNKGANNAVERMTGCYHCHGSTVKIDKGVFDPDTWPNVGVGRQNPDGSFGSCSSCHTRHRFSIAESRKPEACGQCHLGPDHPQVEIYDESKHGAIYHASGASWKWDSAPGAWSPGVDYRAPTCSVCHMSAVRDVSGTHDVTERLAWELQAPLTIRPADFAAFPAKTDYKVERAKMEKVCLACHSPAWTRGHFDHLDKAVANYNEVYYKPAKALMDSLYEKKLLSKDQPFDEEIEIEMYEFWHHEGRRARFGSAMMAPDYAWWHGFYELKKRGMKLEQMAEDLQQSGKPAKMHTLKGTGGETTAPPGVLKSQ